MEIFNREYWGKVSLAAQFVELGHSVTIGYNHRVRHFATLGKRGDIFFETKGKISTTMEHLDALRKNGIILVGQDEEAGISFSNFSDFSKNRPEVAGVGYFDAFFAWGLPDEKEFHRFSGIEKIHRTGSPRTLFWGNLGADFFKPEIQEMIDSFGQYVLIVSNTTTQNSIISRRQLKGIMAEMQYDKSYSKVLESRAAWEKDAFKQTLKAIKHILDNSELNILIRPHPVENPLVWRKLFAGNKRIFVEKEGSGTPAIHGAVAVLHAGSTLGLEAAVSEKKTISLKGLLNSQESEMSANELSIMIKDWEELVPTILSKETFELNRPRAQELLTRWSDPAVLLNQAHIILRSSASLETPEQSPQIELAASRQLKRIWKRIRYGKSPAESMHKSKRPFISNSKFEGDIRRLHDYLGFKSEFTVKQISESTFEVVPAL